MTLPNGLADELGEVLAALQGLGVTRTGSARSGNLLRVLLPGALGRGLQVPLLCFRRFGENRTLPFLFLGRGHLGRPALGDDRINNVRALCELRHQRVESLCLGEAGEPAQHFPRFRHGAHRHLGRVLGVGRLCFPIPPRVGNTRTGLSAGVPDGAGVDHLRARGVMRLR